MKIKELNPYELGRTYEFLERGVWPDWLEGKPADFDKLPYEGTNPTRRCKGDCTIKDRIRIMATIGPREVSWAKWRAQGMTKEEWEKWWNRAGKVLEQEQPELRELLRSYYERADLLEETQEEKVNGERTMPPIIIGPLARSAEYSVHILTCLLHYHERMTMPVGQDFCQKLAEGQCMAKPMILDAYSGALREAIRCIKEVHGIE